MTDEEIRLECLKLILENQGLEIADINIDSTMKLAEKLYEFVVGFNLDKFTNIALNDKIEELQNQSGTFVKKPEVTPIYFGNSIELKIINKSDNRLIYSVLFSKDYKTKMIHNIEKCLDA